MTDLDITEPPKRYWVKEWERAAPSATAWPQAGATEYIRADVFDELAAERDEWKSKANAMSKVIANPVTVHEVVQR